MSDIPGELRYTRTHEWVRIEDDGSATVGITDHAQGALGELVYVELPETGSEVSAGDPCAVVESVKAASDIYAPIEGTVATVNEKLSDNPALVNDQPYDDGWIMRLEDVSRREIEDLMDADAYEEAIEEE